MKKYSFKNHEYEINEMLTGVSGETYELQDEQLGQGGNGIVCKCVDIRGIEYAVKIQINTNQKCLKRFNQEISLMQKLKDSENIIRYIDDGEVEVEILIKNKHDKKTEKTHFLIMELADSNLKDFIQTIDKKVDYAFYIPRFRGLCQALSELHNYAIHRDIKPENILIKGDSWLLSDFGLCEFIDSSEHQDLTGVYEKVGPIYWMSPEAINRVYFKEEKIGSYSDVYQLGMLFAFVLLRSYPGGMLYDNMLETTPEVEKLIFDSISNKYDKRPKDGNELLELFNKATIK